jgi:hypothetical protein
MAKSISRTGKKTRGRPRKDPTSIHLTLLPNQLSALDDWIYKQKTAQSRPEAIRTLLERALRLSSNKKPVSRRSAQKASDLADHAAEQVVDKTVLSEEQERRKRALIKGPKEFRDIREDLPKSKT